MDITYWPILVCGVLSMIVGAIWYGPLFGKKWGEIIGADMNDTETVKKMQKSAGHLYLVQFLLTLFQVFVLAMVIESFRSSSGGDSLDLGVSLWIFAGFIIPMIASGAMWNNDSKKIAWSKFLIQAGYQLIMFVIFGIVLGLWAF